MAIELRIVDRFTSAALDFYNAHPICYGSLDNSNNETSNTNNDNGQGANTDIVTYSIYYRPDNETEAEYEEAGFIQLVCCDDPVDLQERPEYEISIGVYDDFQNRHIASDAIRAMEERHPNTLLAAIVKPENPYREYIARTLGRAGYIDNGLYFQKITRR